MDWVGGHGIHRGEGCLRIRFGKKIRSGPAWRGYKTQHSLLKNVLCNEAGPINTNIKASGGAGALQSLSKEIRKHSPGLQWEATQRGRAGEFSAMGPRAQGFRPLVRSFSPGSLSVIWELTHVPWQNVASHSHRTLEMKTLEGNLIPTVPTFF